MESGTAFANVGSQVMMAVSCSEAREVLQRLVPAMWAVVGAELFHDAGRFVHLGQENSPVCCCIRAAFLMPWSFIDCPCTWRQRHEMTRVSLRSRQHQTVVLHM